MQPLILLGASVRAAAHAALRAGYAPYGIDCFADRDLAAIGAAVKIGRYPHDFEAALKAAPRTKWIYSGGLENHPRLVDRLATVRPLAGNSSSVLRSVRDPKHLQVAARDTGCDFPTMSIGSTCTQMANGTWLIKPRRSSGGMGIRFATPADFVRPTRGAYLQEHVAGEAAGAVFVAANGRVALIGATRQILGRDTGLALPFLYVGSMGPLQLSPAESGSLGALGGTLAKRFGLMGLFNIDFVRCDDRLWILEVNPRYSASMEVIERISDVKLIEWHLQACKSGALPSVPPSNLERYAGKLVVYARQNGIVPSELDDIAHEWNRDSRWPGLADLPRIGEALHAGQPVVTVFADGGSIQTVEEHLRRRAARIEQLLAQA